jgi:hypothetical protein
VLVAVLAFGPFVVLGIVVHLVRKRDIAAEERRPEAAPGAAPSGNASGASRRRPRPPEPAP